MKREIEDLDETESWKLDEDEEQEQDDGPGENS